MKIAMAIGKKKKKGNKLEIGSTYLYPGTFTYTYTYFIPIHVLLYIFWKTYVYQREYWLPKDVHVPNCDQVSSCSKKVFADMIKNLQIGIFIRFIWVVVIKGRKEGKYQIDLKMLFWF